MPDDTRQKREMERLFMKFCVGEIYTHKHMLDAAFLVLKAFTDEHNRQHLKVRWCLTRGLDLNIVDRVTVIPDQLRSWKRIDYSPS